jgi:hypothetical protein
MTYNQLFKELSKLSEKDLKKEIKLYEGCSGNWTTIYDLSIADEDIYHEGEEPGTEHHKELLEYGSVEPVVKNGEPYLSHDH